MSAHESGTPASGDSAKRLIRDKIDAVDSQLLVLLNERMSHVIAIGEIKHAAGERLYDPERERAILQRLADENNGPMTSDAVMRLFERIIDESRYIERKHVEGDSNKELKG